MDKFTATQQSRIVEELSKPETQLSPQQLANVDTVQKTIKRYQTKISDMLKLIQKQRKQNQTLKNQLKQLNQNLNLMIEKINIKNHKKQEPPKDDTIKKSLQNQIKKNVLMKKELDTLRAKVKIYEGQKITDLQDEIRQKDKVIEQQNNTIKMYTKLQKQQSNIDIYKKYSEANEKINSLNGELIHIKKKLTEAKKFEEQQQKSIKRQHEQLLSLDKNQKRQKSSIGFGKKEEKYQNAIMQEANRLKQKVQALQNAKKISEKALRVQIQSLKNKNKSLEVELEEYKNQVNRKDKQAHILVSKMKSLTRKSHNVLQPVDKFTHKSEDVTGSGLFDHRKEFKGLMHLQNNGTKFDDSQSLSLQKAYKIKSIKFIWFEEHILLLATTYQLPDASVKEISSFAIAHQYKNIKQESLTLSDFEYINEMEILCSRFIEFIRIKTTRNQLLQIGTEKNHAKCKKFTYDIKTNEKPIAFMGAIESKKLGGNEFNGNNKEHLISLGIEIKKKDAFTKNRMNPSAHLRSDSLLKKSQKTSSRVGMNEKQENDKNFKVEEELDEP